MVCANNVVPAELCFPSEVCNAESSASLHNGAKSNLGDQVFREVEKSSFIALPGKGGPQQPNDLKTVCTNLGKILRSFIVMVQRGCDQLVDFLLMGYW